MRFSWLGPPSRAEADEILTRVLRPAINSGAVPERLNAVAAIGPPARQWALALPALADHDVITHLFNPTVQQTLERICARLDRTTYWSVDLVAASNLTQPELAPPGRWAAVQLHTGPDTIVRLSRTVFCSLL